MVISSPSRGPSVGVWRISSAWPGTRSSRKRSRIAAAVAERFRVELPAGFRLRIRQTPTLGPAAGLPVRVRVARAPRED